MPMNRDFKDLFAALNAEGAEYLVVGAYALAVHGAPRFTKDLDIWVRPSLENAPRIWNALDAFGAPLSGLKCEDLAEPGIVFQMGVPPNRIDVLTSIDGVRFQDAWVNRIDSHYGDQPVWILGKEELILNKESTGRPQDTLDAQVLRKLK